MNKEINTNELLGAVLTNLPIQSVHPIHKAMLEEACEHVLKRKNEFDSMEQMEKAVHWSFHVLNPIFQSTMNALLEQADSVTINYRGVNEILTKDSPILKSVD